AFVAADAPTAATITFGGFGFQSNESVSLSIAQPGLPLSTSVATDSSGTFTYTLTVPAHTAGGDYLIAATGQTSRLVDSGSLPVGNFALTPSDAMLSGTVSDVTLAAVGFAPNEAVSVWNDAHADLFDDFLVTADETGAFSVVRTFSGS